MQTGGVWSIPASVLLLIWGTYTGDGATVSNTPHHLPLLHLCFSQGHLFTHLYILVSSSMFVFWIAHICGSQACALWLHLPKGQSFWSYLLAFPKPQNNTLSLMIRWLLLLLSSRHTALYICSYCVNSPSRCCSSQCSFFFQHNWDRFIPGLVKSKRLFAFASLQERFPRGRF